MTRDDIKSGYVIGEGEVFATLLSPVHERDLFVREGIHATPVGRLEHDQEKPGGTEMTDNRRANLWWGRMSDGRVTMICVDNLLT